MRRNGLVSTDDNGYPWTYILTEAIAAKDPRRDRRRPVPYRRGLPLRAPTLGGLCDHRASGGRLGRRTVRCRADWARPPRTSSTLHIAPAPRSRRSCSKDALLDPNRVSPCQSAASALTERADSLLATAIGSGIGRGSNRRRTVSSRSMRSPAAIEAEPPPRELPIPLGRPSSLRGSLDCDSHRRDAALCPGRRLA